MKRVVVALACLLSGQFPSAHVHGFVPTPVVTESQKLSPADREFYDAFGQAVAVSGQTTVVTAIYGGVGNASGGSAYIYQRSSASGPWHMSAELGFSDAEAQMLFGSSADIEGNRLVIGAPEFGLKAGSAYVFERGAAGTWTQAAKLTASDGTVGNQFGGAVAISGNRVVVGALSANQDSKRVGAAYVYDRDATGQWNQTTKLTSSSARIGAEFGVSVDLDGDRAVVGAHSDGEGSGRPGAAYVFDRGSNGSWAQSAMLKGENPGNLDEFGLSVSLDGDLVAVGAPRTLQGVNNEGAVHIFQADGLGSWSLKQRIDTNYTLNGFGDFGRSVSLAGSRLLIGAEDHNLVSNWNGAAYLYAASPSGHWDLNRVLVGTDSVDGRFGSAAALDGSTAVVGAWRVDFESGLAYTYDFAIPEPSGLAMAAALAAVAIGARARARKLADSCAAESGGLRLTQQ